MPERGEDRHRSHGFPGMLDPALVASALSVEITAHREGGHVFDEAGRMLEVEDTRVPSPARRRASVFACAARPRARAPTHDPPRADDPVVIVAAGRVAIE